MVSSLILLMLYDAFKVLPSKAFEDPNSEIHKFKRSGGTVLVHYYDKTSELLLSLIGPRGPTAGQGTSLSTIYVLATSYEIYDSQPPTPQLGPLF